METVTTVVPGSGIEVIVPCPSCARPMSSVGDGWQCLACRPTPMNIRICATQKCKRPLTRLGPPWNCWICLHCNEHPDVVNKRKPPAEEERAYIDRQMTEARVKEIAGKAMTPEDVRSIVVEAMAEFSTKDSDPDYPPTHAEIQTMAAPGTVNAKPETYLQKAKRLGVKTHDTGEGGTGGMRKKEAILTDIAEVEGIKEQ